MKIVTLALVLSVGISYVSAWTAPTATPPGGNVAAPINVGNSEQTKTGNLGASWVYAYSYRDAGDLTDSYFMKPNGDSVLKKVIADTICFGVDCKTAWPTSAAETDPTITNPSVKDGVAWSEISGVPPDFADGVDSVGSVMRVFSGFGCATCPYGSYEGRCNVKESSGSITSIIGPACINSEGWNSSYAFWSY